MRIDIFSGGFIMKKILEVLVIAVLVAAPSLFGGGRQSSNTPATSMGTTLDSSTYDGQDKDIVTPKGQFPIVKQPVSLELAIIQNPMVSDLDDNDLTKFLEEKTGIDIIFNVLPSKDVRSKVTLMFASNDLPDVFCGLMGIDDSAILEYGADGQILALDQYIECFGDGIYNMWSTAAEKKLKEFMTSSNGHIYYMPHVFEQYVGIYNQRCYFHGPWMEKLGLQPAETIAEFTEILRAIKTQDPNGNGKADEIPLLGYSSNDGRPSIFGFFLNAFVFWDDRELVEINNGKISPVFIKNEYRQALTWMNSLVKEGLLDPVTFTQDAASMKAIINQDTMVVGSTALTIHSNIMDGNGERARSLIPQPPLEGPNGVKWSATSPTVPIPAWLITKNCPYPAVAYRLGDFMLNEEVAKFSRYGLEGRDWEYVNDPNLFGLDGKPARFRIIREVWTMPSQNVMWKTESPLYIRLGWNEGPVWDGDSTGYMYKRLQYSLNHLMGLMPPESMPGKLVMTSEEADVYLRYKPTIHSNIYENAARFIVGDRSLDEWGAYVAEFDKMGLPRLVETLQSVYDRMSGK
jgi:putative aldouronate transport system substrate-binding protein